MHLLKVISEEERQEHLHPQCVCRGTKRKAASSFALAGAVPAMPWQWEPASSCCSPPPPCTAGLGPRGRGGWQGAPLQPHPALPVLEARRQCPRKAGSRGLLSSECTSGTAPANPAPDTVAANQTAIWVLVSFNSSAWMDGARVRGWMAESTQ